jgi:hypothetical protein
MSPIFFVFADHHHFPQVNIGAGRVGVERNARRITNDYPARTGNSYCREWRARKRAGVQFPKPNGVLADEANAIFHNGVLEIIMGMRGNG